MRPNEAIKVWVKFTQMSNTQKKPITGHLSCAERCYKYRLAQQGAMVEHMQCHVKILGILSERDRSIQRRFKLDCNLITDLYNFELRANRMIWARFSLSKTVFDNLLLIDYRFERFPTS